MRTRFGEKVRFRAVGAPTGWLRRRLGLGAAEDWARDLLAAAEERALWARFGL